MSSLDVNGSLCLEQCQYRLEDLMYTNFYFYVGSTTMLEQHIVYSTFFTIGLCRNYYAKGLQIVNVIILFSL